MLYISFHNLSGTEFVWEYGMSKEKYTFMEKVIRNVSVDQSPIFANSSGFVFRSSWDFTAQIKLKGEILQSACFHIICSLYVSVVIFFYHKFEMIYSGHSGIPICAFRGGKDREGEMRYNPFRITPYLLKVQGTGSSGEEEEPCCLALAERIISGYEGTIFGTTNYTQHQQPSPLYKTISSLFIWFIFAYFVLEALLLSISFDSCNTSVNVFVCFVIHSCSTSDPNGQAHLHHHALPWLCVPGSGWQVNTHPHTRTNQIDSKLHVAINVCWLKLLWWWSTGLYRC